MRVSTVIREAAEVGILENSAPGMAEPLDALDEDDSTPRKIANEDKIMVNVDR